MPVFLSLLSFPMGVGATPIPAPFTLDPSFNAEDKEERH